MVEINYVTQHSGFYSQLGPNLMQKMWKLHILKLILSKTIVGGKAGWVWYTDPKTTDFDISSKKFRKD